MILDITKTEGFYNGIAEGNLKKYCRHSQNKKKISKKLCHTISQSVIPIKKKYSEFAKGVTKELPKIFLKKLPHKLP